MVFADDLIRVFMFAFYYIAWAIGNIIGPQTFRENQAPVYTGGTIAMIVCYVMAIALILVYGLICRSSNTKRADEIVTAGEDDWLDMTDKEIKGFRYTT